MTFTIGNDLLEATFKTMGAELTSLKSRGESAVEFLWQGDKEFWGRQAPVLFPIVGRLKNDHYFVDGKEFSMGQHGFARDKEFTVLTHTDEKIVFSLKSDAETKEMYPYDFELQLQYSVEDNGLLTRYLVKNTGQETMWYSVGGHPAFNVPINGEGEFEDYYLSFSPSKSRITLPLSGPYVDSENITLGQTNTSIAFSRELFANDALIYETPEKNSFTIQSEKSSHKVTVSYDNMPFVGIWSPYPKEAPFVCIEPWQGIADTLDATGNLHEKTGVLSLKQEEIRAHEFLIEVE